MKFDISAMEPMDRYELLLGTVVPRPIAIVTSVGADGAINAAPYSLSMSWATTRRSRWCQCWRIRSVA
jgi:flavin reductase (DIM6/NTAB) family NADH-FMN oxidoreductase RutF